MNKRDWNEGLNNIDTALVEEHIEEMEKIAAKSCKKPTLWLRYIAVAAAVCLVFGTAMLMTIFNSADDPVIPEGDFLTTDFDSNIEYPSDTESGEKTTEANTFEQTTSAIYDPIIFDAMVAPDKLDGSDVEFIVGSSLYSGGGNNGPPKFEFYTYETVIVKARVAKNHPDTYYRMEASPYSKHKSYRLIQMETLEVIRGHNIPQYFLYLIPEAQYVDMSIYDSLIISMSQIGAENYLLNNSTKNQLECYGIPIFADYQFAPELGNIIAFSNGIFDESLWQNKSWIYGYQFGENYLDTETGYLVVYRGYSEEEVIANIYKQVNGWRHNDEPNLVTLNFISQEAIDAINYVKPFDNGVFAHKFINGKIEFRRYINGCETNETVTIDINTEEVIYSDTQYTKEDLAQTSNIVTQLSIISQEYRTEIPIPPHTNPDGKELKSLHLFAWYVKIDGTVYGVIKTGWRYIEYDYFDKELHLRYDLEYYDEAYILCNMSDLTVRSISRDELVQIVGWRNISNENFGIGEAIPT